MSPRVTRIAELNDQGQADTEELRQAVAAYRRLVDVLLDEEVENTADRTSADGASADGELGDGEPAVRSDRTEQV